MAIRGRVLVTGGAGYLGSVLTPKLLEAGYRTTVFDCLLFGAEPLAECAGKYGFSLVEGDLRDRRRLDRLLSECDFDAVIHLAAISNDPSSQLDPDLTRAVNLEGTRYLMERAREYGVARFLYASSASVYGIKGEERVREDLPLEPITLYARYKAEGEAILGNLLDDEFTGVSVRAATVCGDSPRLRLDLTINLLTEHALTRGRIRVFGGDQMRPNIHIGDLTDFYLCLLEAPAESVQGEAFNVSRSNASVRDLAEMIREEIDPELAIEVVPTDDQRSYRLDSTKVKRRLGYEPSRPLVTAVRELAAVYRDGRLANPAAPIYRNVEWLKLRREYWNPTFEDE